MVLLDEHSQLFLTRLLTCFFRRIQWTLRKFVGLTVHKNRSDVSPPFVSILESFPPEWQGPGRMRMTEILQKGWEFGARDDFHVW